MSNDDLSDEDKALFRNLMRQVKPLKSTVLPIEKAPPKLRDIPQKNSVSQPKPETKSHTLSDFIRETIFGNTVLSWKKNGVPEKRMKELASGKISWQAKLDLHRKTVEEASQLLSAFIQRSHASQFRCILIVHGKGEKNNNPPVLKNQVNAWLPQFDEILAFHSALPKDGGTGAVYLLLKRTRSD